LAASRRPQCALLARQIAPLTDWVAARRREGMAFLVMGDFNRVLDAPEEMGAALATAAPLTRATQGRADPCWDGAPFIDHIFAGGPARAWLVPDSLRVQVFRETDDRERSRLSDHCPVSLTLDPRQ
jgi:endonuclease/exonuclease/phosphatase family metal-dependent hydrolase